ncbi:MAG: formylglycine-generating enzyme family protein [Fuerstiella sp.]|nr:formylglycine-generating enzyme family protein [Fuerstiella sp.]MCP4855352.1 formylglycine-generating enzyme family protein [Fuerstiella sp.]
MSLSVIPGVLLAHELFAFGDDAAVVSDAAATTESEMKPYAEVIDHTDVVIDMLPIRGGKFVMGSPAGEQDRNNDEGPQHEVEVAPFWMGKYEITWNQYEIWGESIDISRRKIFGTPETPRDGVADAITRPTPPYTDMSFGMGKQQKPAICMTQHAARTYCKWLSAKTGRYYRLPTEAEWEYACRAGTTTTYSFGNDVTKLDEFAWYDENTDDNYEDVGQKQPNPWGLYDMHGNAAEWVLDQYLPDAYSKRSGGVKNPLAVPSKLYPRIVRGGGWDDDPTLLRTAVREGSSDEWKDQDPQIPRSIWYHTDAIGVGFRVVRPLVEPSDKEKSAKWEKTAPVQLDPVVE